MTEEKRPLILIADRQLATLLSLDALLSLEGYRVTTCSSSFEVLKAVARKKVDLVVAGRVGPERHATLVSKIKTISPETNVLVLTESDEDSIFAESIAAGADGLLRRPYSERELVERVNRLLHVMQT